MNERYPIGEFETPDHLSADQIHQWIEEIRTFPARLLETVKSLSEHDLDKAYREGGWTIRQVVHHVADSHMNAYIRFKLALTEEKPTIRPYAEDKWAELSDSRSPIASSLTIISSLHERWVILLESLTEELLARTFVHPDSGSVALATNIGIYAWHGNHHLAHIQHALQN
ncbi:YfiT family bacillithiol transferase [Rossellomorea marisflavi]|uniref:YfiT family bacillithiol transferase n=1 Tax=Rossellomorea marisflavi TaxID=189381 RepID=UPI00064E7721|nr:putative metal-dependent hydrolase [Rossellomorea marisflavi]KML31234.1 metal-dependent hydrolase [Rossellomorea marisflavi]